MQQFYIEKGQGTPLILLHGNGDDHRYFVHQMDALSCAYHVYAVDTRGHGQSPGGEGEFSLSRFAEDLLAFMDLHHIEKAHLLGFSDGGNIALLFALRYPHRVEKLILNGANLYLKGLRKSVIEGCKSAYDEALPKAEADPAAKRTVDMMRLILQEPNIAPTALCSLPMPTLVIAGTKDMILCRHTKMIARHIPRARLVLMEGDHFIAQKHPEAFNRHVLDFLRQS